MYRSLCLLSKNRNQIMKKVEPPKDVFLTWLYDSMTLLKKKNLCLEETKAELLEDDQLFLLAFLTLFSQCPEI